jgi:anti-sigma factor RsiW
MKHPDEDTMLKSVLGILEEPEERQLQEHVKECPECQARLEKLLNDTKIIGSLELDIISPTIPLPKPMRINWMPLLRAAALLLIGFMVGFGSSNLSHREAVNVIPQRLQVASPAGGAVQYSSCEPVDLNVFRTTVIVDSVTT